MVNSYNYASPEGAVRADAGKLDWTLLPWPQLADVVKALAAGNDYPGRKPDDWKAKEPIAARKEHTQKLLRHVVAYASGERKDPVTGLHPLAHAVCNCLFLVYYDGKRS
jgi:hypothetical protein